MQGAATQAMADIVEDPELRSGRAPPGCDPQAARLVASSSHCPYFTPSIVAPLLMRFRVWLRSGDHMCMNIRPRKPDDANSMPSPLTRAAGEKVAYIKQLLTRGGKFESCESCRQNGIEREKVRNSNTTSIFIEQQSRNQKNKRLRTHWWAGLEFSLQAALGLSRLKPELRTIGAKESRARAKSLQKYPGPLHAQTLEIEGLQACPGLEMTNDR